MNEQTQPGGLVGPYLPSPCFGAPIPARLTQELCDLSY